MLFSHFLDFLPQRSGRICSFQVSIIQRGQRCRVSRAYFRNGASQSDRPGRRIAPGENFAIEAHSPDPYPRPAAGGVYNTIESGASSTPGPVKAFPQFITNSLSAGATPTGGPLQGSVTLDSPPAGSFGVKKNALRPCRDLLDRP